MVGNLEAAVSLLLSTPPESSYFYANALRAVALSSAVSKSLHELAVKVSRSSSKSYIYSYAFTIYNRKLQILFFASSWVHFCYCMNMKCIVVSRL